MPKERKTWKIEKVKWIIRELGVWDETVQTSGSVRETGTCTGTDRPPSDLDSTPTGTTARWPGQGSGVATPAWPRASERWRLEPGTGSTASRRRHGSGPWRRRKPRQRRGQSQTAIRQGRPSNNSVRHTPSENSRPTTPSNSFRGYPHSPLSSLNLATVVHRSQLYFVSVTTVHRFYEDYFTTDVHFAAH